METVQLMKQHLSQRAIDQLYINNSQKEQSKVLLDYIFAGLYKISWTIYLPPYTTIYGDGIDKTKFNMTGDASYSKQPNSTSTW